MYPTTLRVIVHMPTLPNDN